MELDSRSAHLVRLSSTPESLTRKTQIKRLSSVKGLFTPVSLIGKTQVWTGKAQVKRLSSV